MISDDYGLSALVAAGRLDRGLVVNPVIRSLLSPNSSTVTKEVTVNANTGDTFNLSTDVVLPITITATYLSKIAGVWTEEDVIANATITLNISTKGEVYYVEDGVFSHYAIYYFLEVEALNDTSSYSYKKKIPGVGATIPAPKTPIKIYGPQEYAGQDSREYLVLLQGLHTTLPVAGILHVEGSGSAGGTGINVFVDSNPGGGAIVHLSIESLYVYISGTASVCTNRYNQYVLSRRVQTLRMYGGDSAIARRFPITGGTLIIYSPKLSRVNHIVPGATNIPLPTTIAKVDLDNYLVANQIDYINDPHPMDLWLYESTSGIVFEIDMSPALGQLGKWRYRRVNSDFLSWVEVDYPTNLLPDLGNTTYIVDIIPSGSRALISKNGTLESNNTKFLRHNVTSFYGLWEVQIIEVGSGQSTTLSISSTELVAPSLCSPDVDIDSTTTAADDGFGGSYIDSVDASAYGKFPIHAFYTSISGATYALVEIEHTHTITGSASWSVSTGSLPNGDTTRTYTGSAAYTEHYIDKLFIDGVAANTADTTAVQTSSGAYTLVFSSFNPGAPSVQDQSQTWTSTVNSIVFGDTFGSTITTVTDFNLPENIEAIAALNFPFGGPSSGIVTQQQPSPDTAHLVANNVPLTYGFFGLCENTCLGVYTAGIVDRAQSGPDNSFITYESGSTYRKANYTLGFDDVNYLGTSGKYGLIDNPDEVDDILMFPGIQQSTADAFGNFAIRTGTRRIPMVTSRYYDKVLDTLHRSEDLLIYRI